MDRRLGHLTLAVTLGAMLTACDHPTATSSVTSNPSAASSTPAKPAAIADESTWGGYLAGQGKLHAKDVSMRPYIYVIPAGDSSAAQTRRQNELVSVVHGIGPLVLPGGMLILGGPDGKQTTAFITNLSKQLKADALKGIVVMVVSDASEQSADAAALKTSGATLRFVAM